MARSTTPRSGTRRGGTKSTAKAPAKPKATAPKSPPAPEAAAPAPAKPATPARKASTSRARIIKATSGPLNTAKTEAPAKRKAAAKPKSTAPKRTTETVTHRAGGSKSAAKPKAAKPKATTKPKTARKPAAKTRTAKAKAAVISTASAVAAKLPEVKVPKVKMPEMPEVTAKRVGVGAGLLAGIGAAVFLWRSSRADQPDYTVVEQDGDFEVREYPALTTAAATSRGPQADARNRNFRTLADYIFAKSRPGEKLDMTAPVTLSGSATDGWTMRFIMPQGRARADLPAPPAGVTLESHPPRRVGVIRFGGNWSEDLLANKEGALRSWLQMKGYPHEAKAEHAAYNSPMMPGPLRRNELLVTLSEG